MIKEINELKNKSGINENYIKQVEQWLNLNTINTESTESEISLLQKDVDISIRLIEAYKEKIELNKKVREVYILDVNNWIEEQNKSIAEDEQATN